MNEILTPVKAKQQYEQMGFPPDEIQDALWNVLENCALEWAKKGGKPDDIYQAIWGYVVQCGKPYFVTPLQCRKIAAEGFRKSIREFQKYVNGETFEAKYGPNDITSELDEMERDMLANKTYFRFGIDLLDEALGGGVQKEHVLSIIGNPGSMKTSLLLNGIERWVEENEEPVVFFSLDMEKKEIFRRLMLREIGCGGRILKGLQETNDERYIRAKQNIARRFAGKLTVFDNKSHRWTLDEVLNYIKEWTPGLVCIDFLTQLTVGKAYSDYDIVRRAAPALKDISHEYGCAVVELSQMSQASRNIQAAGGMGGSAKGGPVVEENCDHELELFRDTSSTPETGMVEPNIIVTIKKTRGPSAGYSLKLDYDGPQMRFKSTAQEVARAKRITNIFTTSGGIGLRR